MQVATPPRRSTAVFGVIVNFIAAAPRVITVRSQSVNDAVIMPVAVRAISENMLWWMVMPSTRTIPARMALATAACSALLLVAAPSASTAPPYDSQGYLNSTARCTAPDTVIVFGSTASSRVAICSDEDGEYQYRGVRVRDGARLIAPASRSADGAFTASNDGIEYMVTSSGLVVSAGEQVIRDEPMVDFHRPGATTAPTRTPTSTPTTPLPPPLPAEVGGS